MMGGGLEREMSLAGEVERKSKLEFEETELRLGLPGGGKEEDHDVVKKATNTNGKRNFAQTVDLKLNLASKEDAGMDLNKNLQKDKVLLHPSNESLKSPPKAQVVGWPPVRSFRKNIIAVEKTDIQESDTVNEGSAGALVKVSMDGAPYLRKVDLKMYKNYRELSDALGNMFHSITADYVSTYEDKDGDWMLVGDVPWEMFVESCKRLRIMKGADAIGLAPRALAKCKNEQKLNK